ncbi:MAG: cytochrome c biogenesis CcdA family protein [Acidimicrobiia bacterium]|nr:cytochrome c biogenesis CcdA family protein [Acidimicrobiia bacterium]
MTIESLNLVAILAAFFFGALSFLSPCVLPLLPGYLSLMSGFSSEELKSGGASTRTMLRVTGLFIAGFSVVFVGWGLGASWALPGTGWLVWAGWFVVAMGAFIFVTAIWNPKFLLPLMRERRVEVRPSRLGKFAPPVMGVAFGFGWTPCIGPFLGALLAFTAADTSTAWESVPLLLAYSAGLGVPFLAAALATNKVLAGFDAIKKYLRPIQAVSGLLLAGFGVLLITDQITDLSNWFADLLSNIGLDSLSEI